MPSRALFTVAYFPFDFEQVSRHREHGAQGSAVGLLRLQDPPARVQRRLLLQRRPLQQEHDPGVRPQGRRRRRRSARRCLS